MRARYREPFTLESPGVNVAGQMPARKTTNGEYLDVAHPITAAYREKLQAAVMTAYERWTEDQEAQRAKAAQSSTAVSEAAVAVESGVAVE